jgi:tetratricopeptide (TPR) repeat protein
VEFARATVGVDRAESLEYRLNMENLLTARALERPIFGWGRFNRFQITMASGRVLSVPDGFWIISMGTKGLIGLTGLLSMLLLPMVLTIRRFPVATWSDPAVGPVVGLALMMTLTMVDYLSNAMLNPVYALVIGGLMGQSPFRPGGNYGEAEETLAIASELVGQGRVVEAGREFRLAIELASGGEEDAEARRIQADALDGLGQSLLATGCHDEAVVALRDALALRDWLAGEFSDADHFSDLAIARDGLSRALAESGRTAEAIGEREIALQIWRILAADHPKNDDYRDRRANTLNDLAWLLATDPDPTLRDPARALSLAEEAVRSSSDHDASWNTLGVARYRAGDWAGAIEALERSVISAPGGSGTAFDHYFLAMAWFQLQHEDQAREWLERGVAWSIRHRPGHLALERFRREAEALMQGKPGDAVLDRP